MASNERQAHAVLDLPSRRHKGLKIERLLDLGVREQPIRILEVGTGSGGIAHYFATHERLACEVSAVDVHDNRQVSDGYEFCLVHGTTLPFDDSSFDVVISNHVIEHVGEEREQRSHLAELHRVMKPRGAGYLAVPNRWMLVEPHFMVAFLSWLPRRFRSPYLRLRGKGTTYDCEPLQMGQLEHLLADAGFDASNMCIAATRETLEIERPAALVTRLLRAVPDSMLMPLRRVIPTLIYRLSTR